jgi:hypothetical protein
MLHVIGQYYSEKNPLRLNEIIGCLRMNLAHCAVAKVIDLDESSGSQDHLPRDVLENPKFQFVPLGRRAYFKDFFEWSNANLPPKTPMMLVNSDIFLDPFQYTWPVHEKSHFLWPLNKPDVAEGVKCVAVHSPTLPDHKFQMDENRCLPVAYIFGRHEIKVPSAALDPDSTLCPWMKPDCTVDQMIEMRKKGNLNIIAYHSEQIGTMSYSTNADAWGWMSPITVPDCEFSMGNPGCDNSIAHRLLKSGRIPLNRSDLYRVYHYDQVRKPDNNYKMILSEHIQNNRKYPEEDGTLLVPLWIIFSKDLAEPFSGTFLEYLYSIVTGSAEKVIRHRGVI